MAVQVDGRQAVEEGETLVQVSKEDTEAVGGLVIAKAVEVVGAALAVALDEEGATEVGDVEVEEVASTPNQVEMELARLLRLQLKLQLHQVAIREVIY